MDEKLLLRKTRRSLPISLLRARETIMAPIRVMLNESGISEQKWRVVRVLDEAGPMELTALAQAACLLLPSLTRIVRSMEDEGLVARAADPKDGRKSIVSITGGGSALLLRHASASAAIFDTLKAQYGEQRLEQLLDMLEDLTELSGFEARPPKS